LNQGATLGAALPENAVHQHWRRTPLERLRTQVVAREEALHQSIGGGADHHRVGCGDPLQPRRQVRCLAECQLFVSRPRSHLTHHDQASVDTQAHGQPDTVLLYQTHVELLQSLQYPKSSPHGALRIVLVRQGIAKIDQQPIAQILRDMPLKAANHLGAGGLIGAHHLA
jgi:hypothetical protein